MKIVKNLRKCQFLNVYGPLTPLGGARTTSYVFEAVPAMCSRLSSIEQSLAGHTPTPKRRVEAMLRLAEIGPDDTVYDLGCGDGRIVITAAQMGAARAVGVDH